MQQWETFFTRAELQKDEWLSFELKPVRKGNLVKESEPIWVIP